MLRAIVVFVVLSSISVVSQGPTPRAATLAQQKMCDEEAHKKFTESDASTKPGAEYTSHYDARANICYIMVHEGGAPKGVPMVSYLVYDAFEGRVYASYLWMNTQKKKYWEVPPFECWVKPIGHEKIECKSDDEFEELVDKHFGIAP